MNEQKARLLIRNRAFLFFKCGDQRQRLLGASGGERVIVGQEEVVDHLMVYRGADDTDQHGFTTMNTLNISTLRSGWVRKDSFFKVGKTYKFEANKWTVSDLYRVIEVAHVDDPLTPNDDVIAFVIAKDAVSGRQYGTSLTRNDFSKMVLA